MTCVRFILYCNRDMAIKITATSFRKNLYALLDRVIETGNPIDIERKGKIIRILAIEPKSKLSNLKNEM